jgi:hypothetical protein
MNIWAPRTSRRPVWPTGIVLAGVVDDLHLHAVQRPAVAARGLVVRALGLGQRAGQRLGHAPQRADLQAQFLRRAFDQHRRDRRARAQEGCAAAAGAAHRP